MHDTVVIDGELSLVMEHAADPELVIPESGEFGVVLNVGTTYPAYTGPTRITPSEQAQILGTEMTSVVENIIVNPIPSNYGRITWNGSILTVS